MFFMFLMLIVGLVVIIALVAAIVSLVVVGKNSKNNRNAEEITINAKVAKLNEVSQESYSVDSANARTDSVYYVEFKLADNSKQKFKINKKTFRSLEENQEGLLVYKGQKMITFTSN